MKYHVHRESRSVSADKKVKNRVAYRAIEKKLASRRRFDFFSRISPVTWDWSLTEYAYIDFCQEE